MFNFLARRLLQTVVVIIGVTFLAFMSLHISGDPTALFVNERASQEEFERVRHLLGFDRPLPEQYISYVFNLLRGDFGNSLKFDSPSLLLVMERLPATLELTFSAMLISTLLAIPIGIIAATRRGTPWDGGTMLLAITGQSMPSFWFGLMMILLFGLTLRWLPISGRVAVIDPLLAGDVGTALRNIPAAVRYLILPSLTVGLYSLSRNARLVRSSMLEVLPQEYVTTARAKGLSERAVIFRHAFRNALIPIVTMLGLEFGFLLSGVVVTETVFSWPGVGRLVYNAIVQRDIPLVQTSVVVFSLMFVFVNLLVDMLYAVLDPRIRLG
jgi:peptide/nickel transport system permease protein